MAGRQNQSEGTVIPSSHLVRHSPPARRMAATKGASPRLPASLSIRCIQRPPKKADPSPFRLNGGRRGAGRGIFCAHARTDPLPPPDGKIPPKLRTQFIACNLRRGVAWSRFAIFADIIAGFELMYIFPPKRRAFFITQRSVRHMEGARRSSPAEAGGDNSGDFSMRAPCVCPF